ncbi:MAG: DUF4145 domain-containing protein [Promethearchaeota archaeon]
MDSKKTLKRLLFLLKIINGLDGLNGKTSIQKFIFFLQYLRIHDFNYNFSEFHYGPYSIGLEDDLNLLIEEGFISASNFGKKKIYTPNKHNFNEFFEKYENLIEKNRDNDVKENLVTELFQYDLKNTKMRELAATILWIIYKWDLYFKKEIFQAIEEWKYNEFTKQEKTLVWDILCKKSIIPSHIINLNKNFQELDKISFGRENANQFKRYCAKFLRSYFTDILENIELQSLSSKIVNRIDIKAKIRSNLYLENDFKKISVICINSVISDNNGGDLIDKIHLEDNELGIIISRKNALINSKKKDFIYLTDSDLKNQILNQELDNKKENVLVRKIKSIKREELNNPLIPNINDNRDLSDILYFTNGAKELIKNNTEYSKRNACIYLRLSLEKLINSLCNLHNLPIQNLNTQRRSDFLKSMGIITKTRWKFFNAYLGLGNDAAHPDSDINSINISKISGIIDDLEEFAKKLL